MSVTTRNYTINTAVRLETEECCSCGVTFAMPADLRQQRVNDRGWFYCPNGHRQHYTGKTDAERLRDTQRRLEAAQAQINATHDQLEASERSNRAYRGVITRTKKRIANGVCPSCRRHFRDLADHMTTEHPSYADPKEAVDS